MSRSLPQIMDFDAIHKLPPAARYRNVSVLWIAYYPRLIRLLYRLRVPHEAVTLMSLSAGLLGAYLIAGLSGTADTILAVLCVHLKDVLDACDGALARLTRSGHRLGRFMDTIGDGIAFSALILALAVHALHTGHSLGDMVFWSVAAWLSLFLQCSYFNHYHLRYSAQMGAQTLSRIDEREALSASPSPAPRFLSLLEVVYGKWFGWQDRLMAWIDRRALMMAQGPDPVAPARLQWYSDRRFLTANSALCFGTHVFVLIVCLLIGRPFFFFPAVVVGMNTYWAAILVARVVVFQGAR